MNRYYLLIMLFSTLLLSWNFSTQIQGGLRFSENEKLIVSENSFFRKILLKKEKRDYPLKIYKIIPLAINLGLCCVILLIHILYAVLYMFPIGTMIGALLESNFSLFLGVIWYLLLGLYIGIINAL